MRSVVTDHAEHETMELSDDQTYTAAADALSAEQLALYAEIKAARPDLDWQAHDRRAERMAWRQANPHAPFEFFIEQHGADPVTAQHMRHVPYTIALREDQIAQCSACGASMYWAGGPGGRPHPYDVENNRGTSISHFQTCPDADQFRGRSRSRASTRRFV